MTFDSAKPFLTSTVRHGLTLLAGVLVARGAVNPTTAQGVVEGLSGVLVGLIGYGWSLARAGKLGLQAKMISGLIDRLSWSVPLDSPAASPIDSPAASPQWSNDIGTAPVVLPPLARGADGRLLSPQPRLWPMGSPGLNTVRETNPGDTEVAP